jgi:hypothetical protein
VYRIVGRILPVLLLLVVAVAIGDPATDFELRALKHHQDGDWDDAGHVGKLRAHGVNAAVTDTRPTAAPLSPTRRPTLRDTLRPPQVAREPLGSRAPPA